MTIAEAIMQRIKVLPESIQTEVLDFAEYLGAKKEISQSEEMDWGALSLSQAMRGMETENPSYSINDLKEVFV